jgi:pimeloyl-[acyl-carrier protein] methyl ester esterase
MAPLADALVNPVYLVELPGHGLNREETFPDHLGDWIEEVAPQFAAQVGKRAVWVGWSLGVLPVIEAAVRVPEQVAAIVCLAGTPRFVNGAGWRSGVAPNEAAEFAAAVRDDAMGAVNRYYRSQALSEPDSRVWIKWIQACLAESDAEPTALQQALSCLHTQDMRVWISEIEVPQLWIVGERDSLVTAGMLDALSVLKPGLERRLLPGVGHLLPCTAASEVAGLIHTFVSQIESGGGL